MLQMSLLGWWMVHTICGGPARPAPQRCRAPMPLQHVRRVAEQACASMHANMAKQVV